MPSISRLYFVQDESAHSLGKLEVRAAGEQICATDKTVVERSCRINSGSAPQNSKYPPAAARRRPLPVSAGSNPIIPRRFSHAAWFNAGSAPTRSRIIFQAAMLRAPSGGGPIASATEHCGQKQIRCAADFCRGLIPTVCANMYTATDLCPISSSRLQRRQYKFSKGAFRVPCTKTKYCRYVLAGASM